MSLASATAEKIALEKGLPANTDAERFILGSVLLNDARFVEIAGILNPDDFALEKHRRIFVRMTELHERGEKIEAVIREVGLHNRTSFIKQCRFYTGKSPHFIHPKHLVETPGHDWYAAHLAPGDVVLDVGCANGAHTLKAAARVKRIIGMDYDLRQLGVAGCEPSRRAPSCGTLPSPWTSASGSTDCSP